MLNYQTNGKYEVTRFAQYTKSCWLEIITIVIVIKTALVTIIIRAGIKCMGTHLAYTVPQWMSYHRTGHCFILSTITDYSCSVLIRFMAIMNDAISRTKFDIWQCVHDVSILHRMSEKYIINTIVSLIIKVSKISLHIIYLIVDSIVVMLYHHMQILSC